MTKLDGWKGKVSALSLSRTESDLRLCKVPSWASSVRGFDILSDLWLTSVGGGNIGLCLGKMYSLAFQSPVMVYDPYISESGKAAWSSALPEGRVTFAQTLGELLIEADVVSVHVPLTASTKDLIAAPQLRQMKTSAILINSARGGIVHEDDLAEALEAGVIFGAGLDAFVDEPPAKEKYERFCKLPNLVMTWVA